MRRRRRLGGAQEVFHVLDRGGLGRGTGALAALAGATALLMVLAGREQPVGALTGGVALGPVAGVGQREPELAGDL